MIIVVIHILILLTFKIHQDKVSLIVVLNIVYSSK
jgi:hypothetical protein